MRGIRMIRSSTVVLPTKDIDTDQIIAARFVTIAKGARGQGSP